MLLKILIGLYLIFVSVDSATTYIGIRHFGLVELGQSQILFDYYGLTVGMIISTAFCFSMAWLLWKVRRFKMAAYLGLSLLTLAALAAVVNNVILISTYRF